MRAVIEWVTKEMGGRSKPPSGVGSPPYATVVRFTDTDEPWPSHISWSLVVEKIESMSSEFHWVANVSYKMDDAPHDSLRCGRKFELFEGKRCVASGEIITSSRDGPG